MAKRSPAAQDWLIASLLFGVTLLLYMPALGNGFIDWDDDQYVFNNPHVQSGITATTLRWAATTFAAANWHPLTWLSHALDWQLFGLHPAGHHFTSVLIHAANAALAFAFLRLATGRRWPSAFAAALFAWHPLRVESVAWISERKDVLCGFFFLLTLLAYQHYARRPGAFRYGLTLVCCLVALLAKPMGVTLPFVLLLLDYWPLQRLRRGNLTQLALEKFPFLLICAPAVALTLHAQRLGGAVKHLAPGDRVANSVMSYARYIGNMVYPNDLIAFYWQRFWSLADVLPIVIGLTMLSTVFVLQRQKRPWLIVGWLWYLGTLVPVIGLVQVGGQSMADRYTYLPGIGLAIVFAWAMAGFMERWRRFAFFAPALAAAVLLSLAVMTWRQIGVWHDTYSLFSHTLHTPDDQAIDHFLRFSDQVELAARWTPASRQSLGILYCDWGDALVRSGRMDQAAVHYVDAARLDPRLLAAQLGLARCRATNHPTLSGASR